MARVKNLFFHLSGEHETLPAAEVQAILEADNFPIRNVLALPQILCMQSAVDGLSSVAARSGFTRACGIMILRCQAALDQIFQAAEAADYRGFLESGQTFSVEVKTTVQPKINTEDLASALGTIILGRVPGVKVKLNDPDVKFFAILSGGFFILGKQTHTAAREFLKRKPIRQPFSHPSSMSPKLARGMVNLARVRAGHWVLDPFCGTGSILVEAGLVGCNVLGSDISPAMLLGSRLNLTSLNIPWKGLVLSDARQLPFVNLDGIVTDPPYGRISSTHGESMKRLVADFLAEALGALRSGGYISLALPTSLPIRELSEDLGYITVENHYVREHKSLTRELSVMKKP